MSLLSNISKVAFASSIPIDKIIGTYTGTFTAIAPSSVQINRLSSVTITTNILDTTFFQGIFSTDNGVTWNDFNAQTPNLTTPGSPVFQTVQVFGLSQPGLFTVFAQNWYDFVHSSTTTYTILYKVALIAKPTQGIIIPQPLGSNTLFNSSLNYQKIFSDTSQVVSVPGLAVQTLTFTHNLGYVPKVRSYLESSTIISYGAGIYETSFFLSGDSYQGLRIDTVAAYIDIDNSNNASTLDGTFYMRIYYDY